MPWPTFRRLLDIGGIDWFSLQVGTAPGDGAPGLTDLAPHLTDFAETAAAMAHLDMIVSVDSAPAHLAGALGRPVAILVSFDPDCRWLLDRADTPWYPGATLFRQPAPGDWASVVDAVASYVEAATKA